MGDKLENHSCDLLAEVLSKRGIDSGTSSVHHCLSPHLYGVPSCNIYTWKNDWYFFPAQELFSTAHP